MDHCPGHEISTDFSANHRKKRTKVVFLNPSEIGNCCDTDHNSGEDNFTSREDAKRSELLRGSGTCPSYDSSGQKEVEAPECFDLQPQREQSTTPPRTSMNRVNVKDDADSMCAADSAPHKISARCHNLGDRATAEEVQDSSEDDSDTQDSSVEPQAVAPAKRKTQLERRYSPESSPLSSLDDNTTGTSDEEEAEDELACLDPDDDEEHIRSMLSMDPVKLRYESPPLRLPASASDLVCPRQHLLDALGIYEVLRRYGQLLRLSPFRLEDMLAALVASENSLLLAEIHMTLLRALLREDDANNTVMYSADCKDSVCLSLHLMDRYTWPHLLAAYLDQVYATEASAQGAAASLPTLSVAAGTAAGVMGGTTTSGGADIVVSAGVFSPGTLPLHTEYPFVPVAYRVAVLRGLTALFLSTGAVRGEVLRDGFILHEDYCRACDNSGDVLCCDSCPAVFHLNCLVPPLIEVPTTAWYCPVCVENQVSGVTDCLSDAERTGKDHRHEPLGRDRAGRVYWYLGRRLLVEPVDFCQREPDLPGLTDGDYDPMLEVNCALTDGIVDESTRPELVEYADEPSLYYYSSLEQVMQVRRQLSRRWEPWLCHQLDVLLPRMTLEMEVSRRLTRVGLDTFRLLCPSPEGEVVSVLFSETGGLRLGQPFGFTSC